MLNREEKTWIEAPIAECRSAGAFRTRSQQAAFDRLEEIYQIPPGVRYANISPRTRAVMMTGPAGAGKTAVVRAFASREGLPMLSLLASAWVPAGANQLQRFSASETSCERIAKDLLHGRDR